MKVGYHLVNIKKGMLGESSKIQEELDELKDAERQGSKIMALIELSDLYGAVEAYAREHGFKMKDVKIMSKITQRAFRNGVRQ